MPPQWDQADPPDHRWQQSVHCLTLLYPEDSGQAPTKSRQASSHERVGGDIMGLTISRAEAAPQPPAGAKGLNQPLSPAQAAARIAGKVTGTGFYYILLLVSYLIEFGRGYSQTRHRSRTATCVTLNASGTTGAGCFVYYIFSNETSKYG